MCFINIGSLVCTWGMRELALLDVKSPNTSRLVRKKKYLLVTKTNKKEEDKDTISIRLNCKINIKISDTLEQDGSQTFL